ncbi:HNH endonuclease [Chitinophagaceae bacterium 26-R-25]|nr:HNH endonuclease [Chitinophagaceae bacterium 26-R-25]
MNQKSNLLTEKWIEEKIKREFLTKPIKRLAHEIGRSQVFVRTRMKRWGLVVPQHILANRRKDSMFKKGNISHNKGKKQDEYMSKEGIVRCSGTRFKKGNLPHNTKPSDGEITIRTDTKSKRQYKYIRLGLSNWYPYHQYLWEAQHGKISPGYCLWFRDGNSLNCTLENMELISRKEQMTRNTIQRYPEEVKTAIRRISKLKKLIRENEK